MNNYIREPESLSGSGIVIDGAADRKVRLGDDCYLKVIAQFPDDEQHAAPWFRSLFLSCTSEKNQAISGVNILKSRVLFSGDIEKSSVNTNMALLTLHLNLGLELNRNLVKDRYYVTVSSRQFFSNTVVIEIV